MTYLLTTHDKFCGPSCHDLSMVWNQDWVTAIFSHVQPQFQKRFDFFFDTLSGKQYENNVFIGLPHLLNCFV